ncbi:hypothetical protein ACA910_011211 [Epithemia clementina (nom. ined.)]
MFSVAATAAATRRALLRTTTATSKPAARCILPKNSSTTTATLAARQRRLTKTGLSSSSSCNAKIAASRAPPSVAPPTTTTRSFSSPSLGLQYPQQQSQSGGNNTSGTKWAMGAFAASVLAASLHSVTGSQSDFYEYRFKTNKSPEDLASFYGGEEFMELFCIFPFVGSLMMRSGEFDEKGHVHAPGFPGTLVVSMVFSDDTNQETGEIEWFNKRERFHNKLFGTWTAWDMVSNFGFRTCEEDGTIECYHYGEYFHGNLPIVSQIVMLVFKIHARWLAWSTEHHINHYAFTANNEEEEELEEESRKNMPLFLLKHYAWSDLMAMLFGTRHDVESIEHKNNQKVKRTSFLVRRQSSTSSSSISDSDSTAAADETTKTKLPIQDHATKLRVSQDIATDRANIKTLLVRSNSNSPGDVHAVLTRSYSIRKEPLEADHNNDNELDENKETASSSAVAAARRRSSSVRQNSAYNVATEAARANLLARRATLLEQQQRRNSKLEQEEQQQQQQRNDANVKTENLDIPDTAGAKTESTKKQINVSVSSVDSSSGEDDQKQQNIDDEPRPKETAATMSSFSSSLSSPEYPKTKERAPEEEPVEVQRRTSVMGA